jgi:hypothetical protein
MRRTAVLVHIGTFGKADRKPDLPQDLKFDSNVAELAEQLRQYKFDVRELAGNEMTGEEIWPAIKQVVDAHGRLDVVVVYILSHGYGDEDRLQLTVAGCDLIAPDESIRLADNADIVEWLRYLGKVERPYVLLLLDLCFAGNAVRADSALRIEGPNKLWILAAATGAAYDARFTRAVAQALRRLNTNDSVGAELRGSGMYVPLRTFAVQAKEELTELTGTGYEQRMIGSQASITVNDAALPFFPNLSPAGTPTPRLADSFPSVTGIDQVPELAHFVAAIRCHAAGDGGPNAFTGRTVEREAILGWLANRRSRAVQLVTGRAGTGKSALLGAAVCATHQSIAPHLERLGIGQFAAPATVIQLHSAVMSAHNKDTGALAAEIGRQLLGVRDIRSADVLVRRLGANDWPCFVVVDAVDEAVDPKCVVDDLIVPLARMAALRVKILVSARQGESTVLLRDLLPDLATIDLNLTERAELATDLEFYARKLLGTQPDYQGEEYLEDVRNKLAVTIARTLMNAPTAPELGEFLATRLYVEWLIQRQMVARNMDEAGELGRRAPLALAELFEKDMQLLVDREWVRPVLAALAHDVGFGMPAQLIPEVVAAARIGPDGRAPTDREVATTLDSVGRYITVLPSPDGAAYRLFHDALGEHLRRHPIAGRPPVVPEPTLFDALLASVPRAAGERVWTRAAWYVRRYILRCARTTADVETVLLDTGYLLTDAPEIRTAIADLDTRADQSITRLVVAAGAVVDLASSRPRPWTEAQLCALAIAAARAECARLAELLLPDAGRRLRPIFVTTRAQQGSSGADAHIGTDLIAIGEDTPTSIAHCAVAPTLRARPSSRLPDDLSVVAVDFHRGEPEIVTQNAQSQVEFRAAATPDDIHVSLDFDDPVTTAIRAGDTFAATTWAGEIHDWGSNSWIQPTSLIEESINELTYATTAAGEPRLVARWESSLAVLSRTSRHYRTTIGTTFGAGRYTVIELDGQTTVVFCVDSGETFLINVSDGLFAQGPKGRRGSVTAIVSVPSRPRPLIVLGNADGELWTWLCGSEQWQHLGGCRGTVTALTAYQLGGAWFVGSATRAGEVAAWNLTGRTADRIEIGFPVRFLVSRVAGTNVTASPVAVATGFGGLVLAELVGDMNVRTRWVPFNDADNAVQVGNARLGRQATDFWLSQHLGWSVLVVDHGDGRPSVFHPVTGRWLPVADMAVVMTPDHRNQSTLIGTGLGPVTSREEVTAVAAWQHGAIPLAVTCGADRTVRIRELVADGRLLAEIWLPAPAGQVTVVADAEGGYRIVAVTDDDIIVFAFDVKGVRQ